MADEDFSRLERFDDVDATDEAPMFQAFLDRIEQLAAVTARRRRSYALAEVANGDQVIDVGCGLGTAATEMADLVGAGGSVVGVDESDAMVAEATSRHAASRATFQQGDALDLALGDATVDVYRAERLYQHLADPAAALGEAARVLRPGGRVVLIDQDWDGLLLDGTDRELTRSVLRSFSDSIVEGWIGRRFHALLRDAGFTGVEVEAETVVSTDWDDYGIVARLVARTAAADPAVGPDASASCGRATRRPAAAAGRWIMSMTHFLASGRAGDEPGAEVSSRRRSRMCTPQAEPRPMTWARPTLAPSIWRSPASPRRWWQTSQMLAMPVAAIGWPFDSRPPDTLTGVVPSRHVAPGLEEVDRAALARTA